MYACIIPSMDIWNGKMHEFPFVVVLEGVFACWFVFFYLFYCVSKIKFSLTTNRNYYMGKEKDHKQIVLHIELSVKKLGVERIATTASIKCTNKQMNKKSSTQHIEYQKSVLCVRKKPYTHYQYMQIFFCCDVCLFHPVFAINVDKQHMETDTLTMIVRFFACFVLICLPQNWP